MSNDNSMISLSRAFVILEAVAEAPVEGVTFNFLKAKCDDLAGATLSRLLKNLTSRNMLKKDPENGRYTAGKRFELLAGKLLNRSSRMDIIQAAIDKLAEETGQSAAYWEMSPEGVEIKVKHEIPDGHYFGAIGWTNKHTAINEYGQVCLAFAKPSDIKKLTDNTCLPCSPDELLKLLAKIRQDRLLISRKESGLCRVIAPVFEDGIFAGACGISFWAADINSAEQDVETVKKATEQLSQALSQQ